MLILTRHRPLRPRVHSSSLATGLLVVAAMTFSACAEGDGPSGTDSTGPDAAGPEPTVAETCVALQQRFHDLVTPLDRSCTEASDCFALGLPNPSEACHGAPFLDGGGAAVSATAFRGLSAAVRAELSDVVDRWRSTCEPNDSICGTPGIACQFDGVVLGPVCVASVCGLERPSCHPYDAGP